MRMKGKAKTMRFLTIRLLMVVVAFFVGAGIFLGGNKTSVDSALAEYNPIRMDMRGASVYSGGKQGAKQGIRFYAYVDNESYEACENENKRIGFVVGYESDVTGEFTLESDNSYDVTAKADKGTEDYTLFAGEVTGDTFALQLGKPIKARGYFYDGKNYRYTDETLSRSIAYIASAALADGENDKGLIDYVDGATAGAEITVTGGDTVFKADENRKLVVNTAAGNSLVPVWLSNDESVAKVDKEGNLTILKGSAKPIVVTAVLGSRQAELRFEAHAKYVTSYYYENALGEYEENKALVSVKYATPGATVQAETGDIYLQGGGFVADTAHVAYKAESEVSEDNSTVMKVYYKQERLTGDGQLTDADKGTWQITAAANDNPTKPVKLVKDTTKVDSKNGKTYATAVDWQGGNYTVLTFNAKNSVKDYTKYNAISFTIKNMATADRGLYAHVVNPDGSLTQATALNPIKDDNFWKYCVLPLSEEVNELSDIKVMLRFSIGYNASYEGSGKTYLGDFKLIDYQSPENTLLDFGYSSTVLGCATTWGEMAGDNGNMTIGVKDPVTGGSTLNISDPYYITGGAMKYMGIGAYAFHLGQKQNNANGNNYAYDKLKAVFDAKGDKTLKIKFRVYVEQETRGMRGFWIRPFDITKDWVRIESENRIIGNWTDVEFTMDSLPSEGNCRFVITTFGDSTTKPSGQGWIQMSEICISAVTYEYV